MRGEGGTFTSGTAHASITSRRGATEARQFRIPKERQQSPNISIDGFFPNLLARLKITTNERTLDALVQRGRIECDQSALADPGDR